MLRRLYRWVSGKRICLPRPDQNQRRLRFDPWVGICPGGGNGNPPQHSCLDNPTDRGAWRAMVHRIAKSQTQLKWLSTAQHTYLYTHTHIQLTLFLWRILTKMVRSIIMNYSNKLILKCLIQLFFVPFGDSATHCNFKKMFVTNYFLRKLI